MKLVVDTNILISFFRENPVRLIITNSSLLGLKLYAPEYVIEELKKNEQDILKYSRFSSEQFNERLEELRKFIKIIFKDLFKPFEEKAKQLIHDKDIPIFALALKLDCAIWSNEPKFKEQSTIKVFNTKDIIKFLKKMYSLDFE